MAYLCPLLISINNGSGAPHASSSPGSKLNLRGHLLHQSRLSCVNTGTEGGVDGPGTWLFPRLIFYNAAEWRPSGDYH